MKFLPILEKGDTFTTSTGLERTVWKAVIMYIDTEGVIHDDVEQPKDCVHGFAHELLADSGWEICFGCGTELNTFRPFTSDAIRTEKP